MHQAFLDTAIRINQLQQLHLFPLLVLKIDLHISSIDLQSISLSIREIFDSLAHPQLAILVLL
jgi:hypothetical protein